MKKPEIGIKPGAVSDRAGWDGAAGGAEGEGEQEMDKNCKYYLAWRYAATPVPIDECRHFGWHSLTCRCRENEKHYGKLCPWAGYPGQEGRR